MPLHLFQPCMCDSHAGKQATRGDVRTSLSMRTQLILSTTNSEPLMMLLQFLCMNACLIPPCRSGAGWGRPHRCCCLQGGAVLPSPAVVQAAAAAPQNRELKIKGNIKQISKNKLTTKPASVFTAEEGATHSDVKISNSTAGAPHKTGAD